MTNFIIAALGAVLATNPPAAISNLAHSQTGIVVKVNATNDPVEIEFKKLMEEDDAARIRRQPL